MRGRDKEKEKEETPEKETEIVRDLPSSSLLSKFLLLPGPDQANTGNQWEPGT